MAAAFIFPGQGTQSLSMGQKIAQEFSVARDVFQEVDEALGQHLTRLMFEGPQSELELTANAQPAIMSVSMAVFRVMESMGLDAKRHISLMAGHSLGEYSALCAAGVFTLADTARLLRIRGQAMQEAVPAGEGAMAAIIGCDEAELAIICASAQKPGQVCQIANDNGGGQLVISGSIEAVELAVAKVKEDSRVKRAVFLPVSAPFHCSLMKKAADEMKKAFLSVVAQVPKVPVVSNISIRAESDPDTIINLLVGQVTGRVRWRETIEGFAANNVHNLYEIGWGQVLSRLNKRIDKTVSSFNVYEAHEIEVALRALCV